MGDFFIGLVSGALLYWAYTFKMPIKRRADEQNLKDFVEGKAWREVKLDKKRRKIDWDLVWIILLCILWIALYLLWAYVMTYH